MQLAKLSFLLLEIFGIWRPIEWHGVKAWFYDCYTTIMLSIFFTMSTTQLIELIRSLNDAEKFINDGLFVMTIVTACVKCANIIFKRTQIIALDKTLKKYPFAPEDEEEILIKKKSNDLIQWIALIYGISVYVSLTTMTVRSFLVDTPKHAFPFSAWLPYNCDSGFAYWITFICQHIADIMAATVDIGSGSMLSACMLQACAQIKIVLHRLKKLCLDVEKIKINEGYIIEQCIKHHLDTINFAEKVNGIFTYSIMLQYSVSSVIICACIFQLSHVPIFSSAFTSIGLYLGCMLLQIFNLCFFGTVISHQSAEMCSNLYDLDWTSLSILGQKSLFTMMVRASKPIRFSSGYIFVLSLESFTSLLKLSYSTYNLLQHTSQS
uniref:Odorant receptor n=1 Tax=Aulacocentrum confusum TaxID=2767324 RepID=A0A7G8Z972_9HYME|nr:olfactory receptor 53 [Aulacocentrum confusum]